MAKSTEKKAIKKRRGDEASLVVIGESKLTTREAMFVHEYINCGGNATRAYKAVDPTVEKRLKEQTINLNASELSRKPWVRAAINHILDTQYGQEYIKSGIKSLSADDKDDNLRLKAYDKMAKIYGMYGDGGTGTGTQVNVTFNLPGEARSHTKVYDVEAKEDE